MQHLSKCPRTFFLIFSLCIYSNHFSVLLLIFIYISNLPFYSCYRTETGRQYVIGVKSTGFEILALALVLTSCITLGKSLNSEYPFLQV